MWSASFRSRRVAGGPRHPSRSTICSGLLLVLGSICLAGSLMSSLMLVARYVPVRDSSGSIVGTRPNPAFERNHRVMWTLATAGSALVVGAGVLRLASRASHGNAVPVHLSSMGAIVLAMAPDWAFVPTPGAG